MKLIKPFDIIFTILLLLITLFFLYPFHSDKKDLILVVNDKEYTLDFNQNKIIDLHKHYGKKIEIEINNQRARIISSDCKDKICVKFGYISKCGDSAICVPNKVAIYVSCKENQIDAFSR